MKYENKLLIVAALMLTSFFSLFYYIVIYVDDFDIVGRDEFGADIKTTEETDSKIDTEKELIKIEKQLKKEKDGKYKHKPKYEKDGTSYIVNEYVTPSGEVGYDIIVETDTYIESISTGVEAMYRTWKIDKEIATTTL